MGGCMSFKPDPPLQKSVAPYATEGEREIGVVTEAMELDRKYVPLLYNAGFRSLAALMPLTDDQLKENGIYDKEDRLKMFLGLWLHEKNLLMFSTILLDKGYNTLEKVSKLDDEKITADLEIKLIGQRRRLTKNIKNDLALRSFGGAEMSEEEKAIQKLLQQEKEAAEAAALVDEQAEVFKKALEDTTRKVAKAEQWCESWRVVSHNTLYFDEVSNVAPPPTMQLELRQGGEQIAIETTDASVLDWNLGKSCRWQVGSRVNEAPVDGIV